MGFKDYLVKDLSTFIDLDVLADVHLIEGEEVACSVDSDTLAELPGGLQFGVDEHATVIYARTDHLRDANIRRRGYGSVLELDGKIYTVISWSENKGMSQITLIVPQEN